MRVTIAPRYLLLLLLLFSVEGCATLVLNQRVAEFERPPEYVQFFRLLDRAVDAAGVRDASNFPISGFAYLRTNRFLTGLKTDLDSAAQKTQWIRWLQKLDLDSRKKEIQNLPLDAVEDLTRRLGEPSERQILYNRFAFYSEELLAHDQKHPDFFETLQAAVTNPDEYSTAMRVVGLYPLTSLPVALVTHRVQDEFSQWHHGPVDQLETLGELTAYRPLRVAPYSAQTVRLILERASQNALGVPQPSADDRQKLLDMFAPVIYQDVAADYDKIGEVVWQDDKVGVDPQRPTVYWYFSHARLKDVPVLQLNYVFWYSARNGPRSPRIERGLLDGVTVRISLDGDGRPYMVDIMNNCGCYHFYVPHPKKVGKMIPTPLEIDAFVPRRLPASYPQERLSLRIISGWHQVDHMDIKIKSARPVAYRLVAYERLERLPRDDHTYESIFNSRGIGKYSGRIEPLIFFPMGIPDIGSMRQRGHHAIKLVGRAHFDDPELFDKNFEFE